MELEVLTMKIMEDMFDMEIENFIILGGRL